MEGRLKIPISGFQTTFGMGRSRQFGSDFDAQGQVVGEALPVFAVVDLGV